MLFAYMLPGALKTNCDSSTTFHTRRVLSLPPTVTALSRDKLSMAVTLSSCPNLDYLVLWGNSNTELMVISNNIYFKSVQRPSVSSNDILRDPRVDRQGGRQIK